MVDSDQGEKRGEASWHKLVSGPQIFQWQYRLWPQVASELVTVG